MSLVALAHDHMRTQVREAAVLQTLLGVQWSRTMDLADLDRSFAAFQRQALPVIQAGKLRGRLSAAQYYAAAKALAGAGVSIPRLPELEPDVVAVSTSLRVTGLVGTKRAIGRGVDGRAALAIGQSLMLGASKRHVLNGSRSTLVGLTGRDKRSGRYVRVSDGNPCGFCLMLLSRGPVYSAATPDFESHDRCGCSLAPVFDSDPTGGWTDQARAARDAYDSGELELSYGPNGKLSSVRHAPDVQEIG